MKHPDKDIDAVLKAAINSGWRAKILGSGHWRMLCPCGAHTASCGGTPSDWRTTRNLRSAFNKCPATRA